MLFNRCNASVEEPSLPFSHRGTDNWERYRQQHRDRGVPVIERPEADGVA